VSRFFTKQDSKKIFFAETDRLDFEPLSHLYAVDILHNNTGNVRDFFASFDTLREVHQWIDMREGQFDLGEVIEIMLIHKESKRIVGMISIQALHLDLEIGLWISERYQNQGYGKEAIGEILSWLQSLPLNKKIIFDAQVTNIPSNKLALSAGFLFFSKLSKSVDEYNRYTIRINNPTSGEQPLKVIFF
jgi:RimJ/RimL family protein N-acetyltransferase